MNDKNKTKQQLISELNLLRDQINKLQENKLKHEKTELALQQSEQRYKAVIENSPLGIISVDKSGKILIVNKSLIQILGSPSAEATLAINVLTYVPMIEARISAAIMECMESGKNMITEHPYRTKWRKNVFLRLHLAPMRNTMGDVTGLEAIVEDISDIKASEENLRLSEECFRAIADYTYNWESWFGTDGTLLWVNPAVERITGYTVDECLNMDNYPSSIVYEDDLNIIKPVIRKNWGSSAAKNFLFRVKHKNNSLVWISASWQQIYTSDNSPLGTRTSFNDITDRIAIEAALEERQELFRIILEDFNSAFFLLKNNMIVDCSNIAIKILKFKKKKDLINRPFSELSIDFQPDGKYSDEKFDDLISIAKEKGRYQFKWIFIRADGAELPVDISLFSVKTEAGSFLFVLWRPAE